jgi:hypothetical protein
MIPKKCESEILEGGKMGSQGNKQPAMDLGERVSKKVRTNLSELPHTTSMVVSCQVSNGNNIVLSLNQLEAEYTNVGHWEELIDIINKHGYPKEPYTLTSRFRCTLKKNELDKEYMGLYSNGHMIMNPKYEQISYNCCLSNAFNLKLRRDPKILLVKMT